MHRLTSFRCCHITRFFYFTFLCLLSHSNVAAVNAIFQIFHSIFLCELPIHVALRTVRLHLWCSQKIKKEKNKIRKEEKLFRKHSNIHKFTKIFTTRLWCGFVASWYVDKHQWTAITSYICLNTINVNIVQRRE